MDAEGPTGSNCGTAEQAAQIVLQKMGLLVVYDSEPFAHFVAKQGFGEQPHATMDTLFGGRRS